MRQNNRMSFNLKTIQICIFISTVKGVTGNIALGSQIKNNPQIACEQLERDILTFLLACWLGNHWHSKRPRERGPTVQPVQKVAEPYNTGHFRETHQRHCDRSRTQRSLQRQHRGCGPSNWLTSRGPSPGIRFRWYTVPSLFVYGQPSAQDWQVSVSAMNVEVPKRDVGYTDLHHSFFKKGYTRMKFIKFHGWHGICRRNTNKI